MELRHQPVAEVQRHRQPRVHAGRREPGPHLQVHQRRHLAERVLQHPARGGQVVDADVQQRAAGQRRAEDAAVGVVGRGEAEARLQPVQRAETAVAQPGRELLVGRQETRPDGFHQEAPVRARGLDQAAAHLLVGHQRLLAQHRLAGAQRGQDGLVVLAMGRGHVDAVDGRIGQQHRRIGVGEHGGFSRRGPAVGELLRAMGIAAADRVQAAAVEARDGIGEAMGDRARADHGPLEGGVGHGSVGKRAGPAMCGKGAAMLIANAVVTSCRGRPQGCPGAGFATGADDAHALRSRRGHRLRWRPRTTRMPVTHAGRLP